MCFLEISQNSLENTCGRVFFIIKLQPSFFQISNTSDDCFWICYCSMKFKVNINPFHATALFPHHLKTSENQRFSDVFRGYTKRSVAKIGLFFGDNVPLPWHIQDFIKHLGWSFFAVIVNDHKPFTTFAKKTPSQMFNRVLNTHPSLMLTLSTITIPQSWAQPGIFQSRGKFSEQRH